MKIRYLVLNASLALAGVLAGGALGVPLLAAGGTSAETQQQIAQGIALYKERCVKCHSENLAGGVAPALKGDDFVGQWDGKPLRALYSRILMTMPGDDPGSLEPPQVLTLVSYIASANELARWPGTLKSANELSGIPMGRSK